MLLLQIFLLHVARTYHAAISSLLIPTFSRQYDPADNPPKLKSMLWYMLISSLIISQRWVLTPSSVLSGRVNAAVLWDAPQAWEAKILVFSLSSIARRNVKLILQIKTPKRKLLRAQLSHAHRYLPPTIGWNFFSRFLKMLRKPDFAMFMKVMTTWTFAQICVS